ncbi:hypothetical protein GCM10009087_10290 [Sphingomonas oligophenolica]|uniref:HTH crp-type domain-containing protein n=1 Tax=Sphingomonas oligophenolica TaxID=301154 RepID=A0ABU9Y8H8_9SPHN
MSDRVVSNPAKMAENWRVAMSALTNLFLTTHHTLAGAASVGPTELLIYLTVSVANVQKLMRERCIPAGFAATEILPREWVVPISRNAIATASGLPRETVRRQVAQMIESGLLIEDPRGGVTVPIGVIKNRGLEPLLETLLTDFARSAELLLRIGVIEIRKD